MHAHRRRFHHGAVVMAGPRGELQDQPGVQGKQLRARAGGLESHDLQVVADMIGAVPAGVAGAAGDLGLECHRVSDLEALDPGAEHLYNT